MKPLNKLSLSEVSSLKVCLVGLFSRVCTFIYFVVFFFDNEWKVLVRICL